jgi:glutathione synthase/RimK-type ligase-like ATP-grasp enzyme
MMILIVANEFDPHVDAVIFALREIGEERFMRIDLETALHKFDFSIRFGQDRSLNWEIRSKAVPQLNVDNQSLSAVWWRRSSSQFRTDHLTLPSSETLDSVEAYWKLRFLLESIDTAFYPLGHPLVMRSAENKIKQLKVAEACGFDIPETILSNRREIILDFLSDKETAIVKPFKSVVVQEKDSDQERSFKTAVCSTAEIKQLITPDQSVSLLVQNLVKKVADIRVTVFNECIIPCRIETRNLPPGEVDWRPDTFSFEHKISEIPDALKNKIRLFLNTMGLRSGYFDFGLDEAGKYWFFECNPNAQWLWIEVKTGYPIAIEVARQLTKSSEFRIRS